MSFNNNNGAISESINLNTTAPAANPVPPKGFGARTIPQKKVPPKAIPSKLVPQKNLGLNAPMISRVYKAKPGCSACGKKVS